MKFLHPKPTKNWILTIIVCAILLTPFIRISLFTDPFLVPKAIYLQLGIAILVVVIVIKAFLYESTISKSMGLLDILFLVFAFIIITNIAFVSDTTFGEIYVITWLCLIMLYLIVRLYKPNLNFNILMKFLVVTGLIISAIGLLQYSQFVTNKYSTFPIVGFSMNPGPYAFHLASIFPCVLSLLLFNKEKSRLSQFLGSTTIALIIVAIILAESRTSWVAAISGGVFVLVLKFGLVRLKKMLAHPLRKSVVLIVIAILLVGASIFLYQYKPQSAEGRLFIWEIALNVFSDNPLLGVGFDNYLVAHNNYQAEYFRIQPYETKKGYLAGNVEYAFNEFFQMFAELGLIGGLVFIALCFYLLKTGIQKVLKELSATHIASLGGLIAILSACLFSYPLHDIPTLLNFFFFVVVIASGAHKHISYKTPRLIHKTILGILLFGAVIFIYNRVLYVQAELEWKRSFINLKSGNTKNALSSYERLYTTLKHNKYFLFNYAAELSQLGYFDQSIALFKETEKRLNDNDLNNFLAEAYEGINDPVNAEKSFLKSTYIIPHLIYPKFRLAILYHVTEQHDKAKKMAYIIVNMTPKTVSKEAERMKYIVQRVIIEGKSLEGETPP